VPSTLTKYLNKYRNELEESFSNLRLVITNSTSIPKDTVIAFRRILRNGKIATYYGLTEASRSTFMIFDFDGKEESVGLPAPGVQIKLVDDENNESRDGQIWIKGSNVIKNYWNNELTDNIIDGWLKTGDLGYFDDDGYLYLRGRIDDLINVAGEKVNPSEIERVVKLLANIEDVVAVGTKHETFGQVVKLFVKKVTNSPITKSDIMVHCIKNLERYKVPVHIEFVDDFPRTEYGKIKRFLLQ
jgi:acyl-CoA synthetase (AMP-forming)/AMP-acid ligase II